MTTPLYFPRLDALGKLVHSAQLTKFSILMVGLVTLIGLGLILSTIQTLPESTLAATVPSSTDELEQELVTLSNAARTEQSLPQLSWNEQLYAAARAKATHMLTADYFDHVAPDGTTPWSFIRGAGYDYQIAGENLAADFQDQRNAIPAWLASPSHRENLLDPDFTDIGIAVVSGKLHGTETTIIVQMFGQSE